MNIGDRIRSRRSALGYSREKVEAEAGGLVKARTLQDYERSKNPTEPRGSDLEAIAAALKTTVAYLAGEIDNPEISREELRALAAARQTEKPVEPTAQPDVWEFRTRSTRKIPPEEAKALSRRLQEIKAEADRLRRIQELEEEQRRLRKQLGEE